LEDRTRFIDQYDDNISSNEDEENPFEENHKLSNNKSNQNEQKSPTLNVKFANSVTPLTKQNDNVNHNRNIHNNNNDIKSNNNNKGKEGEENTIIIIDPINDSSDVSQSRYNSTRRPNKNNCLAVKAKNVNTFKSKKKRMTSCCGERSSSPAQPGSFYPLAILFGDKPRVSRRECYFSRDTEGVNLYLRLGAVGFGFGVMIFDGFKIAEPWEEGANSVVSCHGHLWIPLHLLHFVYVFWQTYFLFKHHRVRTMQKSVN
uniref:EXS domain-containing protein n=1 Tax=Schistosoma curassoni TaxID=6186 RepID=A0A183KZP2_9TREM